MEDMCEYFGDKAGVNIGDTKVTTFRRQMIWY